MLMTHHVHLCALPGGVSWHLKHVKWYQLVMLRYWRSACRSWYFMFFQCPWLPEFMLTAQDVALFDGCFRSGPIAPRTQGAVSNEDIER